MARRKAVTFLVIEKLTKKLPVTLDPEEREALKDRENELGERVLTLERAHEAASNYAKELSRARKERIEDARAAWAETMDERISGTAQREFKCELRAVIATQSIDLVRLPAGDVVDTRPMNEEERLKYLQGSLLPDKDEPQSTLVYATGDLPALTSDESDTIEADTLPDDECDALSLPHGWPRVWLGRSWRVEGSDVPLQGADVAQVYLCISPSGSTVDALVSHPSCGWHGPAGRAYIVRALALLLNQGLAVKADDLWFASVEAPKEPTEPGRNDSLPEASAAPKPKRRRAKDTGEAAINTALEQSEAHH